MTRVSNDKEAASMSRGCIVSCCCEHVPPPPGRRRRGCALTLLGKASQSLLLTHTQHPAGKRGNLQSK